MACRAIFKATAKCGLAAILVMPLLGCPNPNWGITFKNGEQWKRDYKISLLDRGLSAEVKGYAGPTSDIRDNELTLHFKYTSKLTAADFCTVPESLEVFCQGRKLPRQAGNESVNPSENSVPTCERGLQETFVFRWKIDPALLVVNERGSIAPLQLHIKVSGMINYRGQSLMVESLIARLWIP